MSSLWRRSLSPAPRRGFFIVARLRAWPALLFAILKRSLPLSSNSGECRERQGRARITAAPVLFVRPGTSESLRLVLARRMKLSPLWSQKSCRRDAE